MKRLIGLSLLISLILWQSTANAQDCSILPTCDACVKEDGCGFCGPTQLCLPGTLTGPSQNSTCLLDWKYSRCSYCSDYSDCWSCNEMAAPQSCKWCGSSCVDKFENCNEILDCRSTCDRYQDCNTCKKAQGCLWCSEGSINRCKTSTLGCPRQNFCDQSSVGQFVGGILTPLLLILAVVLGIFAFRKFNDDGPVFTEEPSDHQ